MAAGIGMITLHQEVELALRALHNFAEVKYICCRAKFCQNLWRAVSSDVSFNYTAPSEAQGPSASRDFDGVGSTRLVAASSRRSQAVLYLLSNSFVAFYPFQAGGPGGATYREGSCLIWEFSSAVKMANAPCHDSARQSAGRKEPRLTGSAAS
jgi:hypothetical protein